MHFKTTSHTDARTQGSLASRYTIGNQSEEQQVPGNAAQKRAENICLIHCMNLPKCGRRRRKQPLLSRSAACHVDCLYTAAIWPQSAGRSSAWGLGGSNSTCVSRGRAGLPAQRPVQSERAGTFAGQHLQAAGRVQVSPLWQGDLEPGEI